MRRRGSEEVDTRYSQNKIVPRLKIIHHLAVKFEICAARTDIHIEVLTYKFEGSSLFVDERRFLTGPYFSSKINGQICATLWLPGLGFN